MKYCKNCHVTIENDLALCPLCQGTLIKRKGELEYDYPTNAVVDKDYKGKIRKILIYLFLCLVGLNITLNILLSISLLWAPYFIWVLLYAYFMIFSAMKSYQNMGLTIMGNVYLLSIIFLCLDLLNGFSKWSIHYAIPLLIIAGIVSLAIVMTLRKTNYIDYLIYLLVISIFGMGLLPLLLLGLMQVILPTIVSIFLSFIAFLGMLLFGKNESRMEFLKRFHV